jgi:hypothetical protein
MGSQISNLDPSYITETLTRQVVGSVTEGSTYFNDLFKMLPLDGGSDLSNVNYYNAGLAAGKLTKMLFDLNVNN